ncbi:glycoside hydrolase family 26 protein [Halogeometricum luteum]|uniref:Beta-mannanase n=1 Tax=Halogeometricum luteum TaxID=2950537 RepID=A0ABU2G5U0_9EURY|nr:glycosyl hydrolase [Halogeometricum sp. S3BR5-2]MDS0296152.1 beta-mannanase [Halogeometricum sp. S3BR5-2]
MERRQFLGLVGASAGAAVGVAGLMRTASETGATRTGGFLAGVSVERPTVETLDRFERWTGKRHAVVTQYAALGQSDEEIAWTMSALEAVWARGQVPMLVLEPTFGTEEETPTTVSADVAAGDHDDRVDAWGEAIAGWVRRGVGRPDRRLFVEFAPEMNGDWVKWGAPAGGSTPEDYIEMFRRVRGRVMATGLGPTDVQWVWGPNAGGRGGIPIPRYYPGDDAVDWAAVNGYNWWEWAGWFDPPEIYSKAFERVRSVTDAPLAITEVACSSEVEGGNDPARKAAWIADFYDYVAAEDVKLVSWFEHAKETDWRVFDGVRGTDEATVDGETVHVYDAYKRVMERESTLGAHPTDPRRLTDSEFRGEF